METKIAFIALALIVATGLAYAVNSALAALHNLTF